MNPSFSLIGGAFGLVGITSTFGFPHPPPAVAPPPLLPLPLRPPESAPPLPLGSVLLPVTITGLFGSYVGPNTFSNVSESIVTHFPPSVYAETSFVLTEPKSIDN